MRHNRGVSLLEMLLVFMMLSVLLAISLSQVRVDDSKTSVRAGAQITASYFGLARQRARAQGYPVAVCFPTEFGAIRHTRRVLLIEGAERARLLRSSNLETDAPGVNLFLGHWNLDAGTNLDTPLTTASLDLANWAPDYSDDVLFAFLPTGELVTNHTHFSGAYHLVACQELDYALVNVGATPSARLSACNNPTTVVVSPSGAVRFNTGLRAGSSVLPGGTDLAAAQSTAPPSGTNQSPQIITPVTVAPKPKSLTLPPGIDATVRLDGFLTLEARAGDPDGDALYAHWESDAGGYFSNVSPELPMEYRDGEWFSRYEWAPPEGAVGGQTYQLKCVVSDHRGGIDEAFVGALGTGNVLTIDRGRIVFTSQKYGDTSIYSMNADGTDIQRLTDGNFDSGPVGSPDGRNIIFLSWTRGLTAGGIFVVDKWGGEPYPVLEGLFGATGTYPGYFDRLEFATWSPCGTRIVGQLRDQAFAPLHVRDLVACSLDGSDVRIFDINVNGEGPYTSETSVFWDPTVGYNTTTLAGVHAMVTDRVNNRTLVIDLETGTEYDLPGIAYASVSPRGDRIIYVDQTALDSGGGYHGYIADFAWDPANPSGSISNPVPTTHQTKSCSWSPDGSQLVTSGWDAGVEKVFIQNADGSGAIEIEDNVYFGRQSWIP